MQKRVGEYSASFNCIKTGEHDVMITATNNIIFRNGLVITWNTAFKNDKMEIVDILKSMNSDNLVISTTTNGTKCKTNFLGEIFRLKVKGKQNKVTFKFH